MTTYEWRTGQAPTSVVSLPSASRQAVTEASAGDNGEVDWADIDFGDDEPAENDDIDFGDVSSSMCPSDSIVNSQISFDNLTLFHRGTDNFWICAIKRKCHS
mgnify:CR=1 FL=1